MQEWVRYLDSWVDHEQVPRGLQEGFARELLTDSVEHNEITHYQAHLIMGAFLDSEKRGYT